jgi:hypothetical protein
MRRQTLASKAGMLMTSRELGQDSSSFVEKSDAAAVKRVGKPGSEVAAAFSKEE